MTSILDHNIGMNIKHPAMAAIETPVAKYATTWVL
jgi:hypothetical protein